MANYKSIKITFDIEDEYQLKQYLHIKRRTNSSSYIRTLVQIDIGGINEKDNNSQILKEQIEHKDIIESTENVVKESPKISYPIATIEEDDDEVFLDGLL